MDIKWAKIRLLDSESDLSYSQRITIANLLENLKCCGNCRNFTNSSDGYICDIGTIEDCDHNDICDNWVLNDE